MSSENMVLPSNIDTRRVVRDIQTHSKQSRVLKDRLRRQWVEPMGEVQRALRHIKQK